MSKSKTKAERDEDRIARVKKLTVENRALKLAVADAMRAGITRGSQNVLNQIYRTASAAEVIWLSQLLLSGRPRAALDPLEASMRERLLGEMVALCKTMNIGAVGAAMPAEQVGGGA